jgi:hypothetical protein
MNNAIFFALLLLSCQTHSSQQPESTAANIHRKMPNQVLAIELPTGYKRIEQPLNSFGAWLRNTKIKPNNNVYLYNGQKKANQSAQYAVLDIPLPEQDLQQCADAVIRMRAEWLFATQQYHKIKFTDNAGKSYDFSTPYTRQNFERYLLKVFAYCGSASLQKQLQSKKWNQLSPGDVIIKGGFPGHAVLVMDVAKNIKGNTIYLLAQSYMPAQDFHLLINGNNTWLSPWYLVNTTQPIVTPEYVFKPNALHTWRQ